MNDAGLSFSRQDKNWMSLGAYNLYAKRASFKDDGVLQQFVTEMAGQPIISPPVLEQSILRLKLSWSVVGPLSIRLLPT
ncbi:hypothetical protein TSMEX_001089 [Taenia solium]|eukprot:TsM_000614700 transcript=TsM_000614700 gene=TsM_000614700